jgi:hypothetical protein
MTPDPRIAEEYRSALDLPSVREMLEQIQGLRLLTYFIGREQRPKLASLESQVRSLAKRVDQFYELLGTRHWIFHETLPTEAVDRLLRLPVDEAERALIALYSDREQLDLFIRMTAFRFPEMMARHPLIELAVDDFKAGRFYSVVHVLLSVMDGFVNDFEPQERRGLHARDESDMKAWDSVVSHHLGLANAHRTFTERFSKTSSEEVFELYRNGIVHGVLVNFNNDVVASKAWNRLFAVCDWATSRKKQATDPKPDPSWGDLLGKVRATQEMKGALDAWVPRVLTETDAEFPDHPTHVLSIEFLSAWHSQNFGRMGELFAVMVREESQARTAGMVRDQYENLRLEDFRILQIDLTSPVAARVQVELALGTRTLQAELLWLYETPSGDLVLTSRPGDWRLVLWTPPV